MHPVICQIGPLTVYAYGVMLALAIVICTVCAQREARRIGISADAVVDIIFWTVIGGIIGGRIFFIVMHWHFFLHNPVEIPMLHRGGLAWQGALMLGTLVAVMMIRRKSLSVGSTVDFFAPYIALGQAIGRIGCLLNGCCYGIPVSWGLFFSAHQARLHPTQLYASVGLLIIFFILRRCQRSVHVPGQIFWLYLMLASVQRFIVEFFRADHEIMFLQLSIFQAVSLCFFIGALYAYLFLNRRRRI